MIKEFKLYTPNKVAATKYTHPRIWISECNIGRLSLRLELIYYELIFLKVRQSHTDIKFLPWGYYTLEEALDGILAQASKPREFSLC